MRLGFRGRMFLKSDLRPVARAFAQLLGVELSLRLTSFRRALDYAERNPPPNVSLGSEDLRRARMYVRWIDMAARHHFIRARCLHRSLVLHRWLREDGFPSVLRIGVRKDGARQLAAHAWVELEGIVLNDRPDTVAQFVPLSSPSSANPSVARALTAVGPWS